MTVVVAALAVALGSEVSARQPDAGQARAQMEAEAARNPKDAETQFRLGVVYDRLQAHTEAVVAFRRVVALRPDDARAWDYMALHLEALGQVEQAEAAYRQGLAVNRGRFADPYLDYNFGRLLAKRNRLEESLTHLDRAKALAPSTRAVEYERARVLLRLNRTNEARASGERALAIADPGRYILDLQVYNLLIQTYSRLGEQALAAIYVEKARAEPIPVERLNPGDGAPAIAPEPRAYVSPEPSVAAAIEAAKALIPTGKLNEAIELLRKTVASNPREADAYLLLGTALALVPLRSEAIAALAEAVRLRPDHARGHFMMATALARFGEYPQARASFERALQLDPTLLEAHVQLAMVLGASGEVDAAIGHLSSAIDGYGESVTAAQALFLRGTLYQEQGHGDKAVSDFEQSIRVQPASPKPYLALGILRGQRGDVAGGLDALKKAVELAPADPEAQFRLGSLYLRSGQAVSAVPHLREAVRLRPGERARLYALARALQASGEVDAAAPILQELARLSQAQTADEEKLLESGRLNNEGVALEAQGQFAEALERYRAAVHISPGEVSFQRNLALVLCRLSRWEDAIPELRAVLRAVPGDPDATKALDVALERAPHRR